jgi:hypothetical protein
LTNPGSYRGNESADGPVPGTKLITGSMSSVALAVVVQPTATALEIRQARAFSSIFSSTTSLVTSGVVHLVSTRDVNLAVCAILKFLIC